MHESIILSHRIWIRIQDLENTDLVNPDPVNPDPVNPNTVNPDPVNPDPMNTDLGSIRDLHNLNADPQPCLDVHLEPADGLLFHAAGPAAHGVQVQGGFLHLHSSGFLFLFLWTLV